MLRNLQSERLFVYCIIPLWNDVGNKKPAFVLAGFGDTFTSYHYYNKFLQQVNTNPHGYWL